MSRIGKRFDCIREGCTRRFTARSESHVYCGTCQKIVKRENLRRWRNRHRERFLENRRTYERENREQLRAYQREYQRRRRAEKGMRAHENHQARLRYKRKKLLESLEEAKKDD